MAKVRVYELAKELNLESKKLVDQLQSGGMDIKNYMSTLDEDAVAKAKKIIFGGETELEIIEEKRVKPTVIRRRRKVQVAKDIPETEVETAPEATQTAAEKELPPDAEIEKPEVAIEEDKIIAAPAEEEPEEKPEFPPEEEPKVEVQIPPEEEQEKEEASPPEKELKIKEEIQPEPEKELEEDTQGVEDITKEEELEEAQIPIEELQPVPSVEKDEKAKVISKTKPKKGKKKKVDKPARIIKTIDKDILMKDLPEEKALKPVSEEGDVSLGKQEIKPLEKTEEIVQKEKAAKKSKKAKLIEKEEAKKGLYRRKKKEVYERADLYENRGVKRKSKAGAKKGRAEGRKGKQTEITVPKAIKRRIRVPEFVTVGELGKAMGVKAAELIKHLMAIEPGTNINQSLDFETASVVADEFGYELALDTFEEVSLIAEKEDLSEDLKPRPPVVTIMGHVDHGKTLLLDYIRKSNIIGGESGGITQHIGAYYVERGDGDIVFLDTPGHEAFTAMRARGAEATDIIVLVVAADDGVMPQTREAIDHARAADIPMIVAINKIDKPEADPQKVKRDLATINVAAEDWGGETLFANVSAKTGEGVDELLSLILLQAEMLELKANPDKAARGSVIEAKLDINKGPLATVLIKSGTLHQGDQFVCGEFFGRVRAMQNHRGKMMEKAHPSVPVEISGISGVPMAGDEFIVVKDEKMAKQISEHRKQAIKEKEIGKKGIISLEDLFEKIKEGEVKELNIVLKADVQGSLEALGDLLIKQSTPEVKLKIIHMATGTVTESDIMLASASKAIIIGFNVRANPRVTEIAKNEQIDIRYYDVIYDAVKDIRAAMTGLLEPTFEEQVIGRAYIKEIFHVPKVGAVAGCQVSDGRVERNAHVRLLRDDVVVFDGKLSSLKRFKEDVKEVQSGYECGIGLENYNDIKPGDVFEVYNLEEKEAKL